MMQRKPQGRKRNEKRRNTAHSKRFARSIVQNRHGRAVVVRGIPHAASTIGSQSPLQEFPRLPRFRSMLKKLLPLLLIPLLMAGCQATLTNLTPQTRVRNPDNQYMVEVALAPRQQSM